ncbi:MAG: protein kinase [Verrucomicrobia bacterium]|nr:protein kinase [Verrucomicrobiota bacterium]MBU4427850.1 protein kinase [Verrucomicrobiota bacterium]MCG2680319.1 protein kinase [Kiritimatiellia bacterium]
MPPNPASGDDSKADFPAIEGYEVIELLGRGWMSAVWKARQTSLGRLVAIKVLSAHLFSDPEAAKRFLSDIKLASELKHDGIIPVFDFGQTPTTGCYYLVTDYISGYSLGEWLRRSGRLSESDSLVIVHFVADALRFARKKSNLVHGNIKPDNIMIDNSGTTKVADFGLAHIARCASSYPPDNQQQPPLAHMFQYMSPELASGQSTLDCRSDIYSLGATLYHLLTGSMPFSDSTPEGMQKRRINETVENPQTRNPDLTVGTTRLILKMMAKAPEERYQTWEKVLADIILLERGKQTQSAKIAAAAGASRDHQQKPGTTAPQSGTTPSRNHQDAATAVSKGKSSRALSSPAALPGLKKPTPSFNKTARRSFYIAAVFHVILLFAAGIVVVSRVFSNRDTTFVGQPPPMRSFEPRKLEHQVKVQKRQRSSSRPSMTPRLVAMKGSSFALPEIKVDSKSVKTSFSPKFSTVSGVGMGVGLGMGYGLGGFGQGVSAYNFFGIKGRADRVVIMVDVSESMVEDIRDGEPGYQRVKDKINAVIEELSEQGLFNVIVFADAASSCSTNLMIASLENKQKAKNWLAPFNARGDWGLTSGNLQQSNLGLRALGGTTRLDLALTGAFEQGADTILIISDGLPRVKRELTDQQKEDWDNRVAEWERENAAALKVRARSRADHAGDAVREVRVWVPGTPATRRREGVPAREATEGHWEMRREWHDEPALTPRPVPDDKLLWWSLGDFITHFTTLYTALYVKKGGKKAPVVHCVGYAIDKPGADFLKGLAKYFKGNYRLVGGHAKTEAELANTHRITSKPKKDVKNNNWPPNNVP